MAAHPRIAMHRTKFRQSESSRRVPWKAISRAERTTGRSSLRGHARLNCGVSPAKARDGSSADAPGDFTTEAGRNVRQGRSASDGRARAIIYRVRARLSSTGSTWHFPLAGASGLLFIGCWRARGWEKGRGSRASRRGLSLPENTLRPCSPRPLRPQTSTSPLDPPRRRSSVRRYSPSTSPRGPGRRGSCRT